MNKSESDWFEIRFEKLKKQIIESRVENELMRCEIVALRNLILLIKKKPRLSGRQLEKMWMGLLLNASETLDASYEQTLKRARKALDHQKKQDTLEKN